MPPSLEAFYAYYDAMLAGDELRAGDGARGLARVLFSSLYSGGRLGAAITAGLLPPRWRDAFGLPWRRREQLAHDASMAALRRVLAHTPPALRFVPAYHQAQRRIASARAEGEHREGATTRGDEMGNDSLVLLPSSAATQVASVASNPPLARGSTRRTGDARTRRRRAARRPHASAA